MNGFQVTPESREVRNETGRRYLLTLHPATAGETFAVFCAMYPAVNCNEN